MLVLTSGVRVCEALLQSEPAWGPSVVFSCKLQQCVQILVQKTEVQWRVRFRVQSTQLIQSTGLRSRYNFAFMSFFNRRKRFIETMFAHLYLPSSASSHHHISFKSKWNVWNPGDIICIFWIPALNSQTLEWSQWITEYYCLAVLSVSKFPEQFFEQSKPSLSECRNNIRHPSFSKFCVKAPLYFLQENTITLQAIIYRPPRTLWPLWLKSQHQVANGVSGPKFWPHLR